MSVPPSEQGPRPSITPPEHLIEVAPDVLLPGPLGYTETMLTEARERRVLTGMNYLVIGAGLDGIGGAAARELAKQGANIVINSRGEGDNTRQHKFVDELREEGVKAIWLAGNISEPLTAKALVGLTVEEFGRLDGLIYAPGIRKDFPFFGMSDERMRDVFDVHYFGAMRAIQTAFNQFRRQDPPKGSITVLSSEASHIAPGQINYGGAKAALNQAVRTIALEIGAYKEAKQPALDVTINAVSPGLVTTPLVADLKPEQRQTVLDWTKADRELRPDEVGQLVVYLTSPAAEGMTGKVVPIIGRQQAT